MEERDKPKRSDSPAPPKPMRKKPLWRRLLVPTGMVVVAGGTVLTIVASSFTQARGATRSRQLEFEQRQDVVEQAIHEATVKKLDTSTPSQEADRDDDEATRANPVDG